MAENLIHLTAFSPTYAEDLIHLTAFSPIYLGIGNELNELVTYNLLRIVAIRSSLKFGC